MSAFTQPSPAPPLPLKARLSNPSLTALPPCWPAHATLAGRPHPNLTSPDLALLLPTPMQLDAEQCKARVQQLYAACVASQGRDRQAYMQLRDLVEVSSVAALALAKVR